LEGKKKQTGGAGGGGRTEAMPKGKEGPSGKKKKGKKCYIKGGWGVLSGMIKKSPLA